MLYLISCIFGNPACATCKWKKLVNQPCSAEFVYFQSHNVISFRGLYCLHWLWGDSGDVPGTGDLHQQQFSRTHHHQSFQEWAQVSCVRNHSQVSTFQAKRKQREYASSSHLMISEENCLLVFSSSVGLW